MESSTPEPGLLATLGWVDLTALAILLVFFVLGLFRGFVWQAGRIATLLVAYVTAGLYGQAVADRISTWFGEQAPANLPLYISYFFVFLVVLIIVSIIAFFLEKLVTKTGLTFYNRVGGGVLGIGTGACVVLAMLAVIMMFFTSGSGIVQAAETSRSMTVSKRALEMLGNTVPEPVLQVFGMQPEDAEQETGPAAPPLMPGDEKGK